MCIALTSRLRQILLCLPHFNKMRYSLSAYRCVTSSSQLHSSSLCTKLMGGVPGTLWALGFPGQRQRMSPSQLQVNSELWCFKNINFFEVIWDIRRNTQDIVSGKSCMTGPPLSGYSASAGGMYQIFLLSWRYNSYPRGSWVSTSYLATYLSSLKKHLFRKASSDKQPVSNFLGDISLVYIFP